MKPFLFYCKLVVILVIKRVHENSNRDYHRCSEFVNLEGLSLSYFTYIDIYTCYVLFFGRITPAPSIQHPIELGY